MRESDVVPLGVLSAIAAVERAGLSTLDEGAVIEYEVVANKGKESADAGIAEFAVCGNSMKCVASFESAYSQPCAHPHCLLLADHSR